MGFYSPLIVHSLRFFPFAFAATLALATRLGRRLLFPFLFWRSLRLLVHLMLLWRLCLRSRPINSLVFYVRFLRLWRRSRSGVAYSLTLRLLLGFA